MKKGDIIKLGRIKFKVKDMRTDNQPAYADMSPNKHKSNSPSPLKLNKNHKTLEYKNR
jgi:hypothetical protein